MKCNNIIKLIISFVAIFHLLSCTSNKTALIEDVFKNYHGRHILYINKNTFSLDVYNRDIENIATYRIAYGSNPDSKTKLYSGDNRTPEGVYYINEILSMDADKNTESYRKLNAMNSIFFKASEGHHKWAKPKKDLGYNVYGPRFYRINYPNDIDKKRYNSLLQKGNIPKDKGKIPGIGYGIAIHGNNDEQSIGHLASSGCIRMYNNDIIELEKYIQLKTPVIIVRK